MAVSGTEAKEQDVALGALDALRRMADAGKDARLDEIFLKLTAET